MNVTVSDAATYDYHIANKIISIVELEEVDARSMIACIDLPAAEFNAIRWAPTIQIPTSIDTLHHTSDICIYFINHPIYTRAKCIVLHFVRAHHIAIGLSYFKDSSKYYMWKCWRNNNDRFAGAHNIYSLLSSDISRIINHCLRVESDKSLITLGFIGYSVGATLATYASLDISKEHPNIPIYLVTFGGCIPGGHNFTNSFTSSGIMCRRYENEGDIICKYPPPCFGFRHVTSGIILRNGNNSGNWYKRILSNHASYNDVVLFDIEKSDKSVSISLILFCGLLFIILKTLLYTKVSKIKHSSIDKRL